MLLQFQIISIFKTCGKHRFLQLYDFNGSLIYYTELYEVQKK